MTSTTETLQLEHLCGYLPYGLKYLTDNGTWVLDSLEKGGWICHGRKAMYVEKHNLQSIKPLVIPLSELTRELVNNEMPEQLIRICKTNQKHILTYGYQTICILMKYHFDVFGLLEKGLAVNKLTTV